MLLEAAHGNQAVLPLNGRADNMAFVLAGTTECHRVKNNSELYFRFLTCYLPCMLAPAHT